MEEKIRLLREKVIQELSSLEEGVYIDLDFEPRIIELVLFDTIKTDSYVYKKFGLPVDTLKHIDFTNISFDSFDARGKDFTGLYGVKINPQTIYYKSLHKAILKGVTFIGTFDGVYIGEADFTGSTGAVIDPKKLHVNRSSFYRSRDYHDYYSIKMAGCKFSGVTFTRKIANYKVHYPEFYLPDIKGSDFTGSKGAVIYPDKYIDLINTTLKDTRILGKIEQVRMTGANFKGAIGGDFDSKIRLNPQKVNHDFTNCIFDGVYFTGSFDYTIIEGANFEGSTGAIIDLRKLKKLGDKEKVNFSNTKVIGYDGKKMTVSEDGRIGQDLEFMVDKLLGKEKESIALSKSKLEKAKQHLIEENRKKVEEKIKELLRLVETTEKLGVDPKNLYHSIPIGKEELLVTIDDHYEINRNFIEYLRFLNLSMIDFSNVKVSGLDFRGSAARINPQTVYKRDLSNGVFDVSNIKFYDDFTGVNLEGADFSECEVNPKEKIK